MNQTALLLSFSLALAISAVSYSCILTEPGRIFSGLYKWLEKVCMAKTYYINNEPELTEAARALLMEEKEVYLTRKIRMFGKCLSWTYSVRDREWLFKPLIACEVCVSGQWAFWSFPFIAFFLGVTSGLPVFCLAFLQLLFTLCTIFFTYLFKTLYVWMQNTNS